jgi:hypothetical protein
MLRRDLKEKYQGRSIPAIKEKARIISSTTSTPRITTRSNPVYAAIERRMVALGYGPEVIKSIISPRKVKLPQALIHEVETTLSSTPNQSGWWLFAVNENGAVIGKYLPNKTTVDATGRVNSLI